MGKELAVLWGQLFDIFPEFKNDGYMYIRNQFHGFFFKNHGYEP
jgi:hypothetical protein